MKCDVLIVGAGPVGLAMAAELTRYGVSVRIVDKAPQRTDKSKALVIWSRTLELLDRTGCSASLIAAGYKAPTVSITAGRKQVAHLTLNGIPTPYSFALMLPQSETERVLEEHLNAQGVQVERSVELTRFTVSSNEVASELRHSDGGQETCQTSWLIGCDGAHSTVRHQLGMQFIGKTMPTDWMLADIHLDGASVSAEVNIAWNSDGILAIFPITKNRYRIVADVGSAPSDAHPPDPTLEEVQGILDRRGPGDIKASDPVWLSSFRINERKVSEFRAGRVFVAGDAAHVHSPAGGQGMNTGIQDACNLAWKLALVSRNLCAPEPLLGSYSIERSAVAKQVLEETGRATEIGLLHGEWKQSVRDHLASVLLGFAPIQKLMTNTLTELSIGYPHSPLTVAGSHFGGLSAGARAPLRDDDEQPVGAGDTPRFALFSAAGEEASRLLATYPAYLEQNVRNPFREDGLWLVRPDGYIALATHANDWEKASAYLAGLAPTRVHSIQAQ